MTNPDPITSRAPASPASSDARPEPPPEPLLTVQEVADACEVHELWVSVWFERGHLLFVPSVEGPRFRRADVVLFLRQQGHLYWADEVAKGVRPVCLAARPS